MNQGKTMTPILKNGPEHSIEGILDADTSVEEEVAEPSMYRVFLLNDDFTPMEFVVLVLMKVFGKNEATATQLMLEVHQKGRAIVGVYTREIAETKTQLVNSFSRQHEFPLLCQFEKD